MLLKGFIILITLNISRCQLERDLILTPKLESHVNGKTLYYKPLATLIDLNRTAASPVVIPWEQPLKHVTFLTLYNHFEDIANIYNVTDYKSFMNSKYIPQNISYIPKFGDIITLAHGRLEKLHEHEHQYQFVEGKCNNCNVNNILAYWQVQKIRHRASDPRKFRYEIKFNINPRNSNSHTEHDDKSEQNNKRDINNNGKESSNGRRALRSFILKDHDYPKSFSYLDEHIAQKHRFDDERNIYLERLNAFNEVFTQPKFFGGNINQNTNFPELNIGEYIIPPVSQSRISLSPNRIYFPTTYRPNYQIQNSKPISNNQAATQQYSDNNQHLNHDDTNKSPITTTQHLHHHYYMKNQNHQRPAESYNTINSQNYESSYQKDPPRDAVELIQEPVTTPLSLQNYNYQAQHLYANQIPIPPRQQQQPIPYNLLQKISNPVLSANAQFYMQPIQILPQIPIYLYPANHHHVDYQEQRPFQTSEQEQNPSHYSQMDPLYDINQQQQQHRFSLPITTTETLHNNSQQENHYVTKTSELNNDDDSAFNVKPDSINAQLPPPDQDQDLKIPYIEYNASTASESSRNIIELPTINEKISTTLINRIPLITFTGNADDTTTTERIQNQSNVLKNLAVISSTTEKSDIFITPKTNAALKNYQQSHKLVQFSTTSVPKNDISHTNYTVSRNLQNQTTKLMNLSLQQSPKIVKINSTIPEKSNISSTKRTTLNRSTIERPVLKWKPKRTKLTKELSENSPTKKTTSKFEFQSVPVNVTDHVITVTPSKIIEIPTKKSVSTSISIKVGKDNQEIPYNPNVFMPPIRNIEVLPANLVKVQTNDTGIKFYKAFSGKDGSAKFLANDKDELELTESIVEHVRRL